MDRGRIIKATILISMMIALIIGYYSYLSSRNDRINSQQAAEQQALQMTDTQELIARSAYKEYPTTPTQVVKYYNEITSCFYNDTYSDEELEKLAELCKNLYDMELVANQADYLEKLREDIKVFKSGNITIYDSTVTPATDVVYFEHEGYECAKLNCVYTLKSGTNYQTTVEVYILRKDVEGHWKIFGFALDEKG
ncbi:MAG: hypothetical protein MJ112_04645 [Lachnospiraceae bacterium]|nr:hypothetical protein [Lachnospiraceae bacterium]